LKELFLANPVSSASKSHNLHLRHLCSKSRTIVHLQQPGVRLLDVFDYTAYAGTTVLHDRMA